MVVFSIYLGCWCLRECFREQRTTRYTACICAGGGVRASSRYFFSIIITRCLLEAANTFNYYVIDRFECSPPPVVSFVGGG